MSGEEVQLRIPSFVAFAEDTKGISRKQQHPTPPPPLTTSSSTGSFGVRFSSPRKPSMGELAEVMSTGSAASSVTSTGGAGKFPSEQRPVLGLQLLGEPRRDRRKSTIQRPARGSQGPPQAIRTQILETNGEEDDEGNSGQESPMFASQLSTSSNRSLRGGAPRTTSMLRLSETTPPAGAASGVGDSGGKALLSVTQAAPTALPQELLSKIQAFRVAVEQVASSPSTPADSCRQLHQTSNDLIRYVSGFLIMKYAEEAAEEERKSCGWRNVALPITGAGGSGTGAAGGEASKRSAEVMGPQALQALYAVVDALLTICNCDRGSIYTLDAKTNELVSVVSLGAGAVVKPHRFRSTHGHIGAVYSSGLAVNVLSTERVPPTIFDRSDDKTTGYFTRSYIACPLIRLTSDMKTLQGSTAGKEKEGSQGNEKKGVPLANGSPVETGSASKSTAPTTTPGGQSLEVSGAFTSGSSGSPTGKAGTTIGVLYLCNKVHHLNHGEFDSYDEITAHHAAKLLSTIVQWTSLADLAGSASLDASSYLQSQYLAWRQRPQGERTETKAGARTGVTINEAAASFRNQHRKEQQISRRMMEGDFFAQQQEQREHELIAATTAAGGARDSGSARKTTGSGAGTGAGHIPRSALKAVVDLGRRVDVGSTLFYRLGGRPTQQGSPSQNVEETAASAGIGPQKDVRDVALFLSRMEESWKTTREKAQQQEEVIRTLRLRLYEERKRWRILYNLCVKCGLISPEEFAGETDESLLVGDDELDDTEFALRLQVNEERIRNQHSLVSTQDGALKEERTKLAERPFKAEQHMIEAKRRAQNIAVMRNAPAYSSLKERVQDIERSLNKQLSSATLAFTPSQQQVLHRKKERVAYVQQKLAELARKQTAERDRLLDTQREETEELYGSIMDEDLAFEDALSMLVAPPSESNRTPKVTWTPVVDAYVGKGIPINLPSHSSPTGDKKRQQEGAPGIVVGGESPCTPGGDSKGLMMSMSRSTSATTPRSNRSAFSKGPSQRAPASVSVSPAADEREGLGLARFSPALVPRAPQTATPTSNAMNPPVVVSTGTGTPSPSSLSARRLKKP